MKTSVFDLKNINFDDFNKVVGHLNSMIPSKEQQFNTMVRTWFEKEYPNLDMSNLSQVRDVILNENISIVHHKDYEFAGIIRNDKLEINFGDVPSININNDFLCKNY